MLFLVKAFAHVPFLLILISYLAFMIQINYLSPKHLKYLDNNYELN